MTNSQKKYLVILLAAVLILFPLIIKFALTCDTCDPPCGPCGSCSGGDCGPKCTFPKTNCCTKYNPETGKDEFKDCCDTDINCCDGVCCANPNENCCDGVCRSECGSCCCGNYFCPQNTNCCAHTDTPYYSCCKSGSECCCCVPTENPEVYDQYCGGNCRTCDGEPLCEEGEKCCHGYRPSLDGTTRICCDSDTQLCCEGTCCNIQNCEECVAATDIQGCPYMECQDKCDPVTETCCYGPCCSNENQTCCHSNNNNAGACCNPGEECCQADDDAECCDTSIGEMCCTGLNGADCCDTQIQFCCEGDCCDNICQKCEGGECVDDCEACHKCVSGKCVPCDPCEDCISGKCAPKECKPCHTCNPETGACENDCTQPCQKCEGGECVTCDGDCEECIDDVCVDNCTEDCEECVGDICLATECGDCETCVNDECQSNCDTALCEVCESGSCVDKCNGCQICNNGVCVDNCGDCEVCYADGTCHGCKECQICPAGECIDGCGDCESCREDETCQYDCDSNLCETCNNDVCESCNPNLCQTCNNGTCEDVCAVAGKTCCAGNCCDPNLCETCNNGVCEDACAAVGKECCNGTDCCDSALCEICQEGSCQSTCDTQLCEVCIEGSCQSTCDTQLCEVCNNGICEASCTGDCKACVEGTCVDINITQSAELWYFGGIDAPNYEEEVTLTAEGLPQQGDFTWTVALGTSQVEIITTSDNTVRLRSTGSSNPDSAKDVIINLYYNGDTLSCWHELSVFTPYRIRYSSSIDAPYYTGFGYTTTIYYDTIEDNFYTPIPHPVYIEEDFVYGTEESDTVPEDNWDIEPQGGAFKTDFKDILEVPKAVGRHPQPEPPPSTGEHTGVGPEVDHWLGYIRVGSTETGEGIPIRIRPDGESNYSTVLKWQRYLDHGRHENP